MRSPLLTFCYTTEERKANEGKEAAGADKTTQSDKVKGNEKEKEKEKEKENQKQGGAGETPSATPSEQKSKTDIKEQAANEKGGEGDASEAKEGPFLVADDVEWMYLDDEGNVQVEISQVILKCEMAERTCHVSMHDYDFLLACLMCSFISKYRGRSRQNR